MNSLSCSTRYIPSVRLPLSAAVFGLGVLLLVAAAERSGSSATPPAHHAAAGAPPVRPAHVHAPLPMSAYRFDREEAVTLEASLRALGHRP